MSNGWKNWSRSPAASKVSDKPLRFSAGRELRVIVNSTKTTDEQAATICHDIAKAFEKELTYPGEIKVTVLREARFVGNGEVNLRWNPAVTLMPRLGARRLRKKKSARPAANPGHPDVSNWPAPLWRPSGDDAEQVTSPAQRGRSPSQRREGASDDVLMLVSQQRVWPSPGPESPTSPKGRGDCGNHDN